MRQDALVVELGRRNDRIIERAAALPSRFTTAAMTRRPGPAQWSPAEVLEHLCLSDEGYLARMRPLIREARAAGSVSSPAPRWRPTLMGRLLVWGMSRRSPVRTVASLVPRSGGARWEESLHTFLELRRELARLLEASARLPLRRLRFVSPFSPLVHPNLGDAFRVLVAHGERHLDQIETRAAAPPAGP
jgi:hypothetical protein